MKSKIQNTAHKLFYSVRFQITSLIILILAMSDLFIFLTYNQSINMVFDQAASSYYDLIKLYRQQTDDRLISINNYFENTIIFDTNLVHLENSRTDDEYTLTKIRLMQDLQNGLGMFTIADFIYVNYSKKDDFFLISKDSETHNITKMLKDSLKDLKKTHLKDKKSAYSWHAVNLNGNYYLVKSYTTESLDIGICISVSHLIPDRTQLNLGNESTLLLIDANGNILGQTEDRSYTQNAFFIPNFFTPQLNQDNSNMITITYPSDTYAICYYGIIPKSEIINNLSGWLRYGRYIVIGITLVVPFLILMMLRQLIFGPLNHLVSNMQVVADGDMNVRITAKNPSTDFNIVNQSFNIMLEQIAVLKVNVYKEKFYRQRAELHELKLQLNPHFLLNSLNMIYTLIKTQHLDIAQEFTLCLIKHFRYVLRKDETFVEVNDEMNFIRNYLRLHQLHYPNRLNYNISMPEYLNRYRIPQLMIENLVENAIKYAPCDSNFILEISLSLSLQTINDETYLKCEIQDNGNGFTDENLYNLNTSEYVALKNTNIGISNIKRRLELIYQGNATITFSNVMPQGALVSISIPTDEKYAINVDTTNVELSS